MKSREENDSRIYSAWKNISYYYSPRGISYKLTHYDSEYFNMLHYVYVYINIYIPMYIIYIYIYR